MAENINIGNTPEKNDKKERALLLYEAFSEADEKYVSEMLSDATAARIRAEHRRKTMRFRSSLAACAAVLALVIGLSVIPRGGLSKSDSPKEAKNFAAAERAEDAAPAADAPAKSDEAVNADNAETDKTEAVTTTQAAAEAAEGAEVADEKKEELEDMDMGQADNTPEPPKSETYDENKPAKQGVAPELPETIKTEEKDKTESVVPENTDMKGYIELKDGSGWYVGEYITDEEQCGKLISKEDGFEVYELKGFDPAYIAAVKYDGNCKALITADFRKETLGELAEGLGFKEHLFCEKYLAAETDDYEYVSEEMFRNSTLKLLTDYRKDFRLDPGFTGGIGVANTYLCRIGTENETYIGKVYITIEEDYVIVTCFNASALFMETK